MHTSSLDTTAAVFPGMGPGRFADVARFMLISRQARALLAEADDVLGYRLVDRYRDTEGDYSEHAQVAFLVNCLALASWARDELGIDPVLCTGPSFGGKAAAVFSGSLAFADAVRMTAALARILADYFATRHTDIVTQSFVRTPRAVLDPILAELRERGEWCEISCRVDDDLAMLTLREGLLDWLTDRLRAVGGFPLYVMRPPMHCGIFQPLRARVEREVFADLEFRDPTVPVVADQDGTVLLTGPEVRELLLDGFVRPVDWPSVVDSLTRQGVGRVYVCGPDRLFGRVGRTTRAFDVVPVAPALALRPRRRVAS
jgi:[acyl-carrier-protein] S-malonyltransferase